MRPFIGFLLLCGCGPTSGDLLLLTLKAKGLQTYPNPLGSVPDGSLQVASNVVINRPDVIEPRRGLPLLAVPGLDPATFPSGGTADASTFFQGKLLVHTTMNKLAWTDPAAVVNGWTELAGTYLPPTGQTMRFTEANNNLYFTTTLGPFRLDTLANTPVAAGGLKGLQATASQTGLTGFQGANSQVGYRVLWGTRDFNNNVIFGTPSQRTVQTGFANPVSVSSGNLSRTATTVTVTSTAHGFVNGDVVFLSSTDPNFPSGNKTVGGAAANTFTYSESGAATTSTVATQLYYASRNVSLIVGIPAAATTSYFFQMYRTAQSVDANTDPGDEAGLVFEHVLTLADVAATTFTFTDNVPDSLRGSTLYTSPSQEGLINGNEVPPLCSDLATFKGSLFCAKTVSLQRLNITLLSVGGSAGMQVNDILAIQALGGGILNYTASTGESGAARLFKLFTTGTPAQNVANTAQSLVRIINSTLASNTVCSAYYMSGPDDVPGKILLEAKSPAVAQFTARPSTSSPPYWSPNLPLSVGYSNLARASGVVTLSNGDSTRMAVGQAFILVNSPDNINFVPGIKFVATIPSGTSLTYLEAGINAAVGLSAVVETLNGASKSDVVVNGLAYSKTNQPDAIPLLNYARAGAANNSILRVVPLRDFVYIFKATDGLFRLSGTDPSNFRVDEFDSTVKLIAPNAVARLANQIYAFTTQGVVAISETGVQIMSGPIEGDLLALLAANLANVKTFSFAVGYESERQFLLWTTSPSDSTQASQVYAYNIITRAWTTWAVAGSTGIVDPTNDILYVGDTTASTVRQERKTRTFADFYDDTVGVAVTGHTASTVTLSSAAGVTVGDLLVQGGTIATITAINSNVLTVSPAGLSWTNAAATVDVGYTCQVQWNQNSLGDPGATKSVRQAALLLGDGRFNNATLDFATDISPSFESTAIKGTSAIGATAKTLPIVSDIPQEKHDCTEFTPRFTLRNAQGAFQIYGLSLLYTRVGDRTVR